MISLCIHTDFHGRPLVIGYISAIMGALLFGSVSTVAKPIVSNVNPLMLACFVYLINTCTNLSNVSYPS